MTAQPAQSSIPGRRTARLSTTLTDRVLNGATDPVPQWSIILPALDEAESSGPLCDDIRGALVLGLRKRSAARLVSTEVPT